MKSCNSIDATEMWGGVGAAFFDGDEEWRWRPPGLLTSDVACTSWREAVLLRVQNELCCPCSLALRGAAHPDCLSVSNCVFELNPFLRLFSPYKLKCFLVNVIARDNYCWPFLPKVEHNKRTIPAASRVSSTDRFRVFRRL